MGKKSAGDALSCEYLNLSKKVLLLLHFLLLQDSIGCHRIPLPSRYSSGLKIRRQRWRTGSSPVTGTKKADTRTGYLLFLRCGRTRTNLTATPRWGVAHLRLDEGDTIIFFEEENVNRVRSPPSKEQAPEPGHPILPALTFVVLFWTFMAIVL